MDISNKTLQKILCETCRFLERYIQTSKECGDPFPTQEHKLLERVQEFLDKIEKDEGKLEQ